MSLQLQVAIPLFVTVAALVGIAIWRKYLKPEAFISGITALAIAISVLVFPTSTTVAEDITDSGISENDEISLILAEQYMLQSQYDQALDIINELQQQNGDNATVTLAAARCNALKGNYSLAVQLYNQSGDVDKTELDAVTKLSDSSQQSNAALHKYITSLGGNPADYGINAVNNAVGDYNAVRDTIYAALKAHIDSSKEKFGSEVIKASEAAAVLIADFESYLNGTLPDDKYEKDEPDDNYGDDYDDYDDYFDNIWNSRADTEESSDASIDPEALENALDTLRDFMASTPSLSKNAHIRHARLKGFVMAEDYVAIAESADENVSSQELVIITELYINGIITDSDFSEEYILLDGDKRDELLDFMRQALESNEDTLSEADYAKYEAKIDSLEAQMDEPVAFTIRYDMLDKAQNGNANMRSKLYLSLAKLEYHEGNKEMSDKYIDEALGTASESDDDSYRIPMEHLTGIVNGTADSSDIMNIAEYVDSAINNSLSFNVKADDIPEAVIPDQYPDENPDEAPKKDFATDMTETVTQSTATLNIGVIDKSNFSEVKARVQIQSSQWETLEDIKSHLEVYDCGSKITEFTLEKLEFTTSRIILLCDMSGSMDGAVGSLQQAVRSFAAKMSEGEQVAVVGFSSGINFTEQFSTDSSVVASHADKLYASGGTAVYSSLLYCGDLMPADITSNNIIIVMTDGQDGDSVGEADMRNNIGKMASDKSLTVYTLGLGYGIDSEYLTLMAQSGNGSFLPVESQESLDSFYDFIHGQLANQYILTYKAKNQTLNQRKLEISLNGESGSASKTYYLVDPEYSNEGSDAYNPYPVIDADLSLHGLSTKFLYKSSSAQTVKLRGAGFDAGDEITVRLIGNIKYNIEAKFVDSTTYDLTIPAEIAAGTYDLEISLRGSSASFASELTVAIAGNEKTVKFGSYTFKSLNSYVNDDGHTVLSGNVTMNDWLHFKGDLVITSALTTDSPVHISELWLDDQHGAYITYNESNATGLASDLATSGVSLSFSALGRFSLSNGAYDPQKYDTFPVDPIEIYEPLNALSVCADDFSLSIYPDMLRIQDASVKFELPMQKMILRDLGIEDLEIDKEILVTPTAVGLLGEFSYGEEEGFMDFTLLSLPLSLNSLKISVNTLKGDYSLEAEVGIKAIPSLDSFGLKFGVKNNRFDSIGFGADFAVRLTDAPVPMSVSDFGFEVSGFSQYTDEKSALENLLATEIKTQFDFSVASLNAYLPEIAKLISEDEIALATLDDCTMTRCLKDFRFAFEAKLVICEVFELGTCSIAAGKFDYTNTLIGYYNTEEFGIRAAIKVDRKYGMNNLNLEVEGQSEIVIGYPYTGFWMNGNADFELSWLIFSTGFDVTGDILVGLYENTSGNLQFSIIVKGEDGNGRRAGFHLYITKAKGLGVYTY